MLKNEYSLVYLLDIHSVGTSEKAKWHYSLVCESKDGSVDTSGTHKTLFSLVYGGAFCVPHTSEIVKISNPLGRLPRF